MTLGKYLENIITDFLITQKARIIATGREAGCICSFSIHFITLGIFH